MARKFENYLSEAEKTYQNVYASGDNNCSECKLAKMGFGSNFIITTQLDSIEFYQGLLETKKFKPNKCADEDGYRGQNFLVHLISCASIAIAETGKEWGYGISVNHKTDMVLGQLSKESALIQKLDVVPMLYYNRPDFICGAKSVYLAVNDIFIFAKENKIPLIGGFMKFGGFNQGWPKEPYNPPKLVFNPKA